MLNLELQAIEETDFDKFEGLYEDFYEDVMVSCSRFVWITNSSDHRKIRTANLLHTK